MNKRLLVAILLFLLLLTWAQAEDDVLVYSPKSRFVPIWWEIPGNELLGGTTYQQAANQLNIIPTLGCRDIEVVSWHGEAYQAVGPINLVQSILTDLVALGFKLRVNHREGDHTFRQSNITAYGPSWKYHIFYIGVEEGALWKWCQDSY